MKLLEMLEASIHTVVAKWEGKDIFIVNEQSPTKRIWKIVITTGGYGNTKWFMQTYDSPWELIMCVTLEQLIPLEKLDWQAHNLFVYPLLWEHGIS